MTIMHSRPFKFNKLDAKNVAIWAMVTSLGVTAATAAEWTFEELWSMTAVKELVVVGVVAVGRGVYRWVADNRNGGQ